jgi:hypothetical protein
MAKSRMFKVCKSVHHHTIQIDHQPDATIFQFIILTFGRSPAHHQELNDCSSSLWFYVRIVVIARPQTRHGYHHDMKVIPEAATAVVELLMMGKRTPKRQDNKLKNCCILLVIYLNVKCLLAGTSKFCFVFFLGGGGLCDIFLMCSFRELQNCDFPVVLHVFVYCHRAHYKLCYK